MQKIIEFLFVVYEFFIVSDFYPKMLFLGFPVKNVVKDLFITNAIFNKLRKTMVSSQQNGIYIAETMSSSIIFREQTFHQKVSQI